MNITAIGEILFDVYPEYKKLGGAPFNFIHHVIKLTGKGNFISRVGNDDLGKEILEILKNKKISNDFVQIDDEHKTGVAKPSLGNDKVPDWNIELNRAYDFIELNDKIKNLFNQKTDCLYFGTLAQRSEKSKKTIQSFFNNDDKKYFCDLNIRQNFYNKEIIESSLKTSNVLKLNLDELKLLNDLLYNKNFDQKDTAQKLIDNYTLDLLCVTKGSDGAYLYKANESNNYQVKLDKNEIVDTVGAGDAYASFLCIGFLEHWELDKINKFASEFAAEIVKINGALPDNDSLYEKFKERMSNN